jgi:acetyl-CoA carboxylase biotin carboxylase subunit
MFQRILIANRGEIALRVIRACRELGVTSVVVFSEADRGASYLQEADRAICIGGGPSAESYLNIPRIIAAAEVADVQAIHPGYGFLSENPEFAEICRSCGFEFIGPSHDSIRRMGLKTEAKLVANKAKVPCVPGSDGPVDSEEEAQKLAVGIGFPVLIKAAAGGGGKGMRVVRDEASFLPAYRTARAEAEASFRNPSVYLERYLDNPRHIEVQLLADQHGHVVHCWERDCTVQRRHQKLVEESPSPVVPDAVRVKICESAVRLAKAVNYHNAGTCEFLYDPATQEFFFIEVNARIQVEHPVTELVTGLDLIKWQIRIAAGEKLTLKQSEIKRNGHAIECRINCEDPSANFRPSPGTVSQVVVPGGPGVRWDSHVVAGYKVPTNYDSMVGKLLVHADTREEAIRRMSRALREIRLEGIATTIPFHRLLMQDDEFRSGKYDTTWLEREFMPRNRDRLGS